MAADMQVVAQVSIDDSNVDKDVQKTESKISSAFGKIGTGAKVATAAFTAIGTAAVAVGTKAVTSAVSLDSAMNQFAASTGVAETELAAYEETLKSIYANNFGESFEDIANAMATVTQQVGDLDQASLQTLTESAFLLRDTFGYDVSESVRAASTIVQQFGVSGETAMNLIATGAQNGLDFSGELIDSINEYSVHFAKVGMDAADMFAIFEAGANSGAFNLDKIGDAIKEMSIRVVDGSATTAEGFATIGLNADEMAAKFAAGGDAAKEAFTQTIEALAGIEDPLAQNQAGVNLFGTMWEDLGAEAVTALADMQSGAYETSDALAQMNEVKYDDLGSMLEELKRSVELLLVPLGEALIPAISEIATALMPIIEQIMPPISELLTSIINELLPPIVELINQLLPPIMELTQTLLPPLIELVGALIEPLAQILGEVLPPLVDVFNAILEPIMQLVDELLPSLTSLFDALIPVFEMLSPLVSSLADMLSAVLGSAMQELSPIISGLASILSSVLGTAIQLLSPIIEGFVGVLQGLMQFISGVFSGNWKSAWEGIKNVFGSVFKALKELFKSPINWIIDKLNSFIRGINKIKIPDWVPGIGGKGINIPTIPRLKIGLDYVPSDDFPALLHKGEAVLTADEANLWRSLGGMPGIASSLTNSSVNNVNYNIEKFADYFVIREEADIQKIATALYQRINMEKRSRGLY